MNKQVREWIKYKLQGRPSLWPHGVDNLHISEWSQRDSNWKKNVSERKKSKKDRHKTLWVAHMVEVGPLKETQVSIKEVEGNEDNAIS